MTVNPAPPPPPAASSGVAEKAVEYETTTATTAEGVIASLWTGCAHLTNNDTDFGARIELNFTLTSVPLPPVVPSRCHPCANDREPVGSMWYCEVLCLLNAYEISQVGTSHCISGPVRLHRMWLTRPRLNDSCRRRMYPLRPHHTLHPAERNRLHRSLRAGVRAGIGVVVIAIIALCPAERDSPQAASEHAFVRHRC